MCANHMVAQSPRLIERIVNKGRQLIAFWLFHCSHSPMNEATSKATNEAAAQTAIDRIEAALSRLESVVSQTRALQDRHGRLRGTVEEALGEIDALLAQRRS